MELKKIITIIVLFSFSSLYAEVILPNKNLTPIQVIKIQLEALKNNDDPKLDSGIEQTWLFAHPKNKEVTGPYQRFKLMLYDVHYRILLNHFSHKIDLIYKDKKKHIFGVKIISKEKKQFYYEWHVELGTDKSCKSCWFTSVVSMPRDQGSSI